MKRWDVELGKWPSVTETGTEPGWSVHVRLPGGATAAGQGAGLPSGGGRSEGAGRSRGGVLPEGMRVVCKGANAVLECPDPVMAQAYRELTGMGTRVPIGMYFFRHWWPEFGKTLAGMVAQIRCEAATSRGAVFTHGELARRSDVHLDTIRQFIRWWDGGEAPRVGIPTGDVEWVRSIVRLYIPRIAPDPYHATSGRPPYRYWALADAEILHEKHQPALREVVTGCKRGQREFFFPSIEGLGVDGGNRLIIEVTAEAPLQTPTESQFEPRLSRGLDGRTPTESGFEAGNYDSVVDRTPTQSGFEGRTPTESYIQPRLSRGSVRNREESSGLETASCMHACMPESSSKEVMHAGPEPATPDDGSGWFPPATQEDAIACLKELRFKEAVIAELLGLEDGIRYVVLWGRHILPTRRGTRNPAGLLRRAVTDCCNDPASDYYADAQTFLSRRREAALRAQKNPPRVLVTQTAPAPPRVATEVEQTALPLWETLRAHSDHGDWQAHWSSAVAVALQPNGALLVTAPKATAEFLRRHKLPAVLRSIHEAGMRFPEVQISAPGGGRS